MSEYSDLYVNKVFRNFRELPISQFNIFAMATVLEPNLLRWCQFAFLNAATGDLSINQAKLPVKVRCRSQFHAKLIAELERTKGWNVSQDFAEIPIARIVEPVSMSQIAGSWSGELSLLEIAVFASIPGLVTSMDYHNTNHNTDDDDRGAM